MTSGSSLEAKVRWLARLCAASGGGLALIAGVSWVFNRWSFTTFGPEYVPMAPSTALMMVLLSVAAWLRATPESHRAARSVESACSWLVLIAGMVFLLLTVFGFGLSVAHWLTPGGETMGGIPVGRMSPLTAVCFVLAATALLSGRVGGTRWRPLRVLGGKLALAMLLLSGTIVASYLAGTPLLYGGATIPMALLTGVAFALVSAATLLAAGGETWPLQMFLGERADFTEDGPRRAEWALLLLFLVLASSIIVISVRFLNYRQAQVRDEAGQELEAIADLKVQQIVNWRKERLGDANLIFQTPFIGSRVREFLSDPSQENVRRGILAWFNVLRQSFAYERVVLLDPQLNPRLSTSSGPESISMLTRQAAREALDRRQVVFTDLHRHPESGQIHLVLMVPLLLRGLPEEDAPMVFPLVPGEPPVGVIILQVNVRDLLYPMIQSWPTPSPTAEAMLIRREGREILYLNELRHWKGAAMTLRRSLDEAQLPVGMWVRGQTGWLEGVDYRGMPVMETVRTLPESTWLMVAKVDKAELYAPLRRQSLVVGVVALGLLLAAALGVTLIWRRRNEHFLRVQLAVEHERRVLAERFEHLMRSANDAILLADEQNRILEANDCALALYGYSQAELRSMTLRELRPPERRGEFERHAGELNSTHHAVFETLHQRKDGAVFPVEVSSRIVEIGGQRYMLGILRDLTERKHADARLQLQGAALEAAANGIVIADQGGTIIWVNAAFTRMTGYSTAETVGRNTRLLKSGLHRASFYQNLWETVLAGNVWRGELRNKRKDGSLYDEEMIIAPVKDTQGQISHFIAIKQDITEKKELEKRLLRSQRMESIGQLAGGMAHDLNNVLAPIRMCVDLVRPHLDSAESHKYLDIVRAGAERGATIVQQVLTFARGAEGDRVPLQLRHLVEEIVKMIRETFPKNIQVKWNVPQDLWLVKGDATHLHQVLMNLCVNARDAMPEGGELRLTAQNQVVDESCAGMSQETKPGRYVCFTVSDTGLGMAPALIDRIFEPFFTTKAVGKGSGLGLAAVHGIVRSHEGFLRVSSEVGRGSQFMVFLPATSATGITVADAPRTVVSRGQGEWILVVDDEQSMREVAANVLTHNGYRVLVAADGTEGLAQFMQHRQTIALVLSDLMMPVMDGLDMIRSIRQLDTTARIMVSTGLFIGTDMSPQVEELKQMGITSFLQKPYNSRMLLAAVHQALHAEV